MLFRRSLLTLAVVGCLVTPSLAQLDFQEQLALHVGCFQDDPTNRDLGYEVESSSINGTIPGCIGACRQLYYKYAGVQSGQLCFCGSTGYGRHGAGQCTVKCVGDVQETCGGESSNTIFKTGINVPGPPRSLQQKSRTASSIEVTWTEPENTNGVIEEYVVTVSLNFSYNPDHNMLKEKVLRLSGTKTSASVIGLLAGSKYNVSVQATTEYGAGPPVSDLFWSEVGVPRTPQPPHIVRHAGEESSSTSVQGQIHVQLEPVEEYEGPITSYLVIVIDATFPSPFDNATLYDYKRSLEEGLTYWIAAELKPSFLDADRREFVVGDNRLYGGYLNHGPLQQARDYHVSLAAVSTLNGDTRRSFAKVSHAQHTSENMIVFQFHNHEHIKDDDHHEHMMMGDHHHHEDDHHHNENRFEHRGVSDQQHTEVIEGGTATETGLIIGVVIVVILLVSALLVFLFLRYSYRIKRRRRRPDTQELTASVPSVDPSEAGYIDNASFADDELRTAEDYLAALANNVWQIPRNFVELNNQVLGRGKFGTVMRGTVMRGNAPVVGNMQVMANRLMEPAERQRMLKDLDLNIRSGVHENIVNLVGLCEEQDTTIIVMEPSELMLKQFLLDSRAVAVHPSYAEKSNRFSTVREDVMLSIVCGVARGLEHLADRGIQHSRICARMIFLSDGYLPKIGGIGMSYWERGNEQFDPTRWLCPEAIMSRQVEPLLIKQANKAKMDTWSFGCLLWEVATLGATPYSDARTREVLGRVMRGSRLPRTSYMSESLYQLMLTCWMTDPDERPNMASVNQTLREIVEYDQGHLSFGLYAGFHYEPYNKELELFQ